MGIYRKKLDPSIVVEAIQLTPDTAGYLEGWCGGRLTHSTDALDDSKKFVELNVPTNGGVKRVSEGGWVLKGRSFQVLTDDEFGMIFEEV